MWRPLLLLLSIAQAGCSLNQKRFDKLRIQSEFHPRVVFSNEFHSKNGSDLLGEMGKVLHDDPLIENHPLRSHFVEPSYDFMIPEGRQQASIAAILSFVSDAAAPAPTFEIRDDLDWFTIGSQKSKANGEGVLETEVSIDTKNGVYIDPRSVDADAYVLEVTALVGNSSVIVPIRVDILPSLGVIRVQSDEIKAAKKEEESEMAADSREDIEGTERKTTPRINPTTTTTTVLSTTTTVTETPTNTVTTQAPTTTVSTTVSTTVFTTPSTTTSTTTVPSTTTVSSTTTTTEATTPEPSTTPSTTTTTESTTTTEAETTAPPTTTVSTPPPTTTVPTTTTSEPTTTTTVAPPMPIIVGVEGLVDGAILVRAGVARGELVNDLSIAVEREGRPDGTLFNVTIDRSDLFDINPKSVEQGGKAFLFVRDPHMVRETKGLVVTITATSSSTSSSTTLPVTLLIDSSSEIIPFSLPESSPSGQKVGDLPERTIENVFALEGIPFTLINSSLFLSCDSELCLDRETVDHYEFFVKFADAPTPLSVVIRVSDINDNPPTLSLSEQIIRVSSNRMLSPLAITVSDPDTEATQSNAVVLSGEAAPFFTIKSIEDGLYDLQLTSSPSNGNYSLTVSVLDTSRPDFPSHSLPLSIVVQRGKAHFRKELYERTIAAEKIAAGDSLLRLELEGVPVDEVDIVCLGGNPGWVTVESYGGKMSAGALPRKGIEEGEFTLIVGAIDRETSEVVADTRVKITVEGGVKRMIKITSPFHKNIYTFKTIREHSDSLDGPFTVEMDLRDSSVVPTIVPSSVFALDSNGVATRFPLDSLSLNGSTLSIERASFANLRLIRLEVEAEDHQASVLIFFSSSSIVMEKLRRELSRPLFALPEGTEEDAIDISLQEESALGRVIAVLPAVDASKGESVETRLEGEMAPFFHVQQSTGALVMARRLDLESLSSPFFNLTLLAGEDPFQSSLSLHFTVENVDDNPPVVHPNSLLVNTSVWENAAVSSRVASLSVSDIDSSSLRFALVGERAGKFAVKGSEEGGAVITLEKEIHREEDGDQLTLILLAIDSAGHTAEATVNIRVMDVNDHSPEFVSVHSTQLRAVENWEAGRLLSVFKATDKDQGENGRVEFRMTQTSPMVTLNRTSGELRLAKDLIGMAGQEIPLTIMAHDSGSPQRSTLLNLTLSVGESMGREQLVPSISNLPEDTVITINDRTPAKSRIFTVEGVSPSGGKGGLVYDLLPSTPSEAGWIDIDKESGVISLLRSIDSHEKRDISGVLTIRSSTSALTRSLFRLHVNSSTESLASPIKENAHLFYSIGRTDDWPKILGRLPVAGGLVSRVVDEEGCSNSSSVSIEESGEISLIDDPKGMERTEEEVCVDVRRGSRNEPTRLRFTVLREEKKEKERFLPPHSHPIVLGKEGMEEIGVFASENNHVEYRLKQVNFTESSQKVYEEEKRAEDFSPLFVVDPITAKIIVDPAVKTKKNGVYEVTIEATRENVTVGEFKREIHSISSSSQVRLVFDMTPHELGRNAETFERKLNGVLKERGEVHLTAPSMDSHSNKSSVCLHVLLNSALMPQSTALSLLSLPTTDSPLTNLYHAYKVSDLGSCDSSVSVSSLLTSSFSSSFIISSSIVSLLSFLLISSLLYVCCLLRERDRVTSMEKSLSKESESPQLTSPSQFYAVPGQSMVPYGLY